MNLIVYVGSPKPCDGPVVGMWRENGRSRWVPSLVDVLNDDVGLTNRFVSVNQNRHLLVNRVWFEEQFALWTKRLLEEFVANRFEVESDPRPHESWRKHSPTSRSASRLQSPFYPGDKEPSRTLDSETERSLLRVKKIVWKLEGRFQLECLSNG